MTKRDAELLERVTTVRLMGSNPRLMGGKTTVRGLRITVEQILLALAHGVAEQELLDDTPS